MTFVLLFAWLQLFDTQIGRAPSRKFLLILYNFSAHGVLGNISDLFNTTLQFLPTNAKSRIQPLDAEIIAVLKSGYKKRMLFQILNNLDAGHSEIFKVEILSVMRWVQKD